MRLEILRSLSTHGHHKRNEHNYAPIITDPFTIDKNWYNNLPNWIQESLKENFPDFQLEDINYPNKGWKNYEYLYWKFYLWYNCDIYDMSRYIDILEDAQVVLLDKEDKKVFRSLFKGQHEYDPEASWKDMKINTQIQEILDKYKDEGCFVKLTQRSGKNDTTLFQAHTIEQVYENLIHSNDVYKEIETSKGIVLQKWKILPKENEFRVFILNRKIKGISQQYWDKPLKTMLPFSEFEKAAIKIKELIEKIPYNDAVFDMYIDSNQIKLIEINPAGRWAASSSALFTWEELYRNNESIVDKTAKLNLSDSEPLKKESDEENKIDSNEFRDTTQNARENIARLDVSDSNDENNQDSKNNKEEGKKNNSNKNNDVDHVELDQSDNTDFPIRMLFYK